MKTQKEMIPVSMENAGLIMRAQAGFGGIVEEDTKVIEFNPEKEFGELGEHIAKKMAEMNG